MKAGTSHTRAKHAPLENEFSVILGTNVERLRKERNINKSRFAMMLGIGRPTLNRIEKGIHNPRLDLLCNLADALEVTIFDLLTIPERNAAS